jgi:hypothetical protein
MTITINKIRVRIDGKFVTKYCVTNNNVFDSAIVDTKLQADALKVEWDAKLLASLSDEDFLAACPV